MMRYKYSAPNTVRYLLIAIALLCTTTPQASEVSVNNEGLQHELISLSAYADRMTQALMLYQFSQSDPRYGDKMDNAKQLYVQQAKTVYASLGEHQIAISSLQKSSKQFYIQYKTTTSGVKTSNYTALANQLIDKKASLNKEISQLSQSLQDPTKSNNGGALARNQAALLQQMTEFYMTMHLGLKNPNPALDIDQQTKIFSQQLEILKGIPLTEETQKSVKKISKKWTFVKRSLSIRGQQGTPEIMHRYSDNMMQALLKISSSFNTVGPVSVAQGQGT